tara:strand:- start:1646 stop:2236 length:591 start_codon:yes stop_codon:yes gene_type:complete
MLQRIALSALLLVCAGCTQWYYDLGSHLDESQIPDPAQGVSLQDVLTQLGPPQRISASAGGYLLAWEHWKIREQTLGFRLGLMGADVLSVDWGDAHVKGEFLLLTFDRAKQLSSASVSVWDNRTGGGRSVQPFASLVTLVDIDDLTQPMPQHSWGATSLEPLPVTLNVNSRPDTGQTGVGQRGTPTAIGQQTLEMN